MATAPPLLLALDYTGTFAFALNGALTAVRAARLDIVGVVTLGIITALGGGIVRDVLIGSVPPTAFQQWPYLALAGGGGLLAFALSQWLDRLETPINVLDAVGLSTFAVIGASTALEAGLDVAPAILLGAVTAVGGGTIRDTLVRRVPSVLQSDLYAIPALVGAAVTVATIRADIYGVWAAAAAVGVCFVIRMLGVHFGLQAPVPPGSRDGSN
ncbi:trimeric intracellular cation channel family protein [Prauserella alba]|uniref:Trimeric intracellular cation channel family protein n=1 Tax=Prauserella alba TaxID=176898 RepID=A0ABP4G429_9PSEU|nr:trimeric intracellular cation channel family protein [Prauserella alba]MCP2182885.1 putative membrane protein YeiH [Prauserella alba]